MYYIKKLKQLFLYSVVCCWGALLPVISFADASSGIDPTTGNIQDLSKNLLGVGGGVLTFIAACAAVVGAGFVIAGLFALKKAHHSQGAQSEPVKSGLVHIGIGVLLIVALPITNMITNSIISGDNDKYKTDILKYYNKADYTPETNS
ncbi:hypothetical protein [Facilibium subflavum]|uniref:hypothetical protein n=1 Tax=Facilibium subflavum TaxID=2219058 RepID=UPI000E65B844|nr:hypothetical protein [Facilibium subflavum]